MFRISIKPHNCQVPELWFQNLKFTNRTITCTYLFKFKLSESRKNLRRIRLTLPIQCRLLLLFLLFCFDVFCLFWTARIMFIVVSIIYCTNILDLLLLLLLNIMCLVIYVPLSIINRYFCHFLLAYVCFCYHRYIPSHCSFFYGIRLHK